MCPSMAASNLYPGQIWQAIQNGGGGVGYSKGKAGVGGGGHLFPGLTADTGGRVGWGVG